MHHFRQTNSVSSTMTRQSSNYISTAQTRHRSASNAHAHAHDRPIMLTVCPDFGSTADCHVVDSCFGGGGAGVETTTGSAWLPALL